MLFTYVEGEELSPASMDEAKSVFYGSGVAEMHNAADDFICSHPRIPLDMTLLVDTSLNAIQPVLEQQEEKWAYLVQLAQFVKERIDLFSHQGLEVGVCHGDAQGGNAFMDVENNVTFFDFDNCGYGWRAYELAVFYWATALGKSRLGKSDEEIERMWTAYLKGYQERRPLQKLDKQAIPFFVIVRHFWFLGTNAANWDYWGWNRVNNAFFHRELAFLKEWVTQKIESV